jgi:2-desacetyl-2-hydroxyethyl bacteriochlorophyllide A dehydrogenase
VTEEGDGPVRARGLWFRGPREVELGDVEVPPLAPGQVLVRSTWSGISSGTELLAYRGQIDPAMALDESLGALQGSFTYPFRYGYCCVGRVEASSSAVPEGALVVALHPHQDVFTAPVGDVVVLGDERPRLATLLPLVETALQISLDAGPAAHELVVVTGLGAVGLLSALLLQRVGAEVLACDPSPWRRDLAGSLGVPAIGPGDLAGEVAGATGGLGTPLLVEVSGDPDALRRGLDVLAHEGTALVASWYGTKPVSLPLGGAFHRRRLVVRSTQVSTIPSALAGRWTVERRRQVARALLPGLPLERLATHDFRFTEAAAAFEALDHGEEGLLHAALRYE